MKRRRCLVPATGSYEWQALDKMSRQAWAIELADRNYPTFVCLRDRRKDEVIGQPIEACTIITPDPDELMV
jgi:putative SOS response-associated peptidase YedK